VIKGVLRDTANMVSHTMNLGDKRLDDIYLKGGDEDEPHCPPVDSLFEPTCKDFKIFQ